MMQEIRDRWGDEGVTSSLMSSGRTNRPKTPAEFVKYPQRKLVKNKPFVVLRVEYVNGAPKVLSMLSSWIGRRIQRPNIKFRGYGADAEGGYFEYYESEVAFGSGGYAYIPDSSENSRMETRVAFKGKNQGFFDLEPKSSISETVGFFQTRKSLTELPNNSQIRPKSSFIVVQLGDQIRLYSSDQVPSNIKPALDQSKPNSY